MRRSCLRYHACGARYAATVWHVGAPPRPRHSSHTRMQPAWPGSIRGRHSLAVRSRGAACADHSPWRRTMSSRPRPVLISDLGDDSEFLATLPELKSTAEADVCVGCGVTLQSKSAGSFVSVLPPVCLDRAVSSSVSGSGFSLSLPLVVACRATSRQTTQVPVPMLGERASLR